MYSIPTSQGAFAECNGVAEEQNGVRVVRFQDGIARVVQRPTSPLFFIILSASSLAPRARDDRAGTEQRGPRSIHASVLYSTALPHTSVELKEAVGPIVQNSTAGEESGRRSEACISRGGRRRVTYLVCYCCSTRPLFVNIFSFGGAS